MANDKKLVSLTVPKLDPFFYIDKELRVILERMENLSRKHPINILVSGKQGCGKSSLVSQFGAVYNRPTAHFQIGILSEPGQLFGEQTLKNGETSYRPYLFPEALQTPGCVIHLEEINRPENPKALNMLYSILAEDREIWMDELGLIKVADNVVFFATMNEGEEYIGTEMLDPALRDRFYTVLMDYIPPEVEAEVMAQKAGISREQALEIVGIINKLRGHSQFPIDVSTRTSLMIAELVALGTTIRDAIVYSLQTTKEHLESILLTLHLENGNVESKASEYILFNRDIEKVAR